VKEILAKAAYGETGENRGMMRVVCPVCGKEVCEQDLETYELEASAGKVEMCGACREDFESDNDVKLDADVLPAEVFDKLYEYVKPEADAVAAQRQSLNETTAPLVAEALGGDAWQSGGGIWLVVKRTVDGRVVTISDEVVAEFENEAAFAESRVKQSLALV